MHFDDAPGDSQAEAGSALLPCAAVVDLLEFVEDHGLVVGGDAEAGVAHRDFEVPVDGIGENVDRA